MAKLIEALRDVLSNAACTDCDHTYADHRKDAECALGRCACKGFQNQLSEEDKELKEDLMRVMEKPAKAHSDVKNALELAVRNGILSNDAMQKMVTRDGFPKPVTFKYIQPGLVGYEYMNGGNGATVLVTKNALDKMLADPEKTIIGKPVINEAHREVSPDDYRNGGAAGTVIDAWYEPADGWYYCDALIWDEDTRRNLSNNDYSVSCEYTSLAPWGPAGTLNQIPYDKEVKDGRYKHLAVVASPRYEAAQLMNSTGGSTMMKLLQWLKKDTGEVRNSVEVDARTAIEIDGKEVPLENAVTAWKEQEAAKAKAAAELLAIKNSKVLTDSDTVTIDGKQVTVSALKNALDAQAKNASDEKFEKDHKDGDHKDKPVDNCKMCNAEEKDEDDKKKKDEEAKNTLLMNSQHKLGQHVQPNEKCAICDGIASERLKNAARQKEGKLPSPVVPSVDAGLRRGKELMGKTRVQQEAEAAAK